MTSLSSKIPGSDYMLQWFACAHLPEDLRSVSERFALLAHHVVETMEPSAERSTCLRKLLEAKDAAVRCALEGRMRAAERQGQAAAKSATQPENLNPPPTNPPAVAQA